MKYILLLSIMIAAGFSAIENKTAQSTDSLCSVDYLLISNEHHPAGAVIIKSIVFKDTAFTLSIEGADTDEKYIEAYLKSQGNDCVFTDTSGITLGQAGTDSFCRLVFYIAEQTVKDSRKKSAN